MINHPLPFEFEGTGEMRGGRRKMERKIDCGALIKQRGLRSVPHAGKNAFENAVK